MYKLPSEIRQHLARENGSDNWELNELRRGILREINVLEAGRRTEPLMDTFQPTTSFLTSANRKSKPSPIERSDNHDKKK